MLIKEGRWGPYVTDGETNASLRKGDRWNRSPPQRGAELLAERRLAASSRRRTRQARPGPPAPGGEVFGDGSRKSRSRPRKGA